MKLFKEQITKDYLFQQYVENKKSSLKIAIEIGCSDVTVRNYLRKYKINIRNNSESHIGYKVSERAKKIMSKKMRGENNPNWKNGNIKDKCDNCGIDIYVERWKFKTLKHHFCSKKCFYLWQSANKKKQNQCLICKKELKRYNAKLCHTHETIRRHQLGILNSKGSKNGNWQKGISKLPYAFEFNAELKESIRKRDGYICQKCGITEEEHLIVYGKVLSIHHIDYNKQNYNEINLITLCGECNTRVNFNRNYWKNYFNILLEEKSGAIQRIS